MRKWPWIIVGSIVVLAAVVALTPLRYVVFPKPLTANQQAILRRANAGLAVFATKSPTADRLYQESQRSGRWSRFMTLKPVKTLLGERGKDFSLTVMSSKTRDVVAFYLHPIRSVCFVEAKCESLGYLPLGLTYAHELGHRDDCMRGLITISDLPNGRALLESEARARILELTILQEFTAGRFSSAADQHLRSYRKLSPAKRRQFSVDKITLNEDNQWVQHEFGNLSPNDQSSMALYIAQAAGIRKRLAGRSTTMADSLEAVIQSMNEQ